MMLLWQPRSDHFDFKAFIPVCLWCLSDGIILTQINGKTTAAAAPHVDHVMQVM